MLHTSIKMTKFICNRDMTMKKIRPSKRIFIFSIIEASFSKGFFPDDLYPQFISQHTTVYTLHVHVQIY